MLTLRFEMDDVPALQSLKRGRRVSVEPCASPECCAKRATATMTSVVTGAGATFESCCARGALFPALNPAENDDDDDGDEEEEARRGGGRCGHKMSEAQEFPFGAGGDFGDDEDFDLGPPPLSGPVLVRQKAMDFTAAREAKSASLAQKLDPRATSSSSSSSAALRSSSQISSQQQSAMSRRGWFVGG
ncbi:hypothetical protein Gpo141_00006608 [Globisporangium polare]